MLLLGGRPISGQIASGSRRSVERKHQAPFQTSSVCQYRCGCKLKIQAQTCNPETDHKSPLSLSFLLSLFPSPSLSFSLSLPLFLPQWLSHRIAVAIWIRNVLLVLTHHKTWKTRGKKNPDGGRYGCTKAQPCLSLFSPHPQKWVIMFIMEHVTDMFLLWELEGWFKSVGKGVIWLHRASSIQLIRQTAALGIPARKMFHFGQAQKYCFCISFSLSLMLCVCFVSFSL